MCGARAVDLLPPRPLLAREWLAGREIHLDLVRQRRAPVGMQQVERNPASCILAWQSAPTRPVEDTTTLAPASRTSATTSATRNVIEALAHQVAVAVGRDDAVEVEVEDEHGEDLFLGFSARARSSLDPSWTGGSFAPPGPERVKDPAAMVQRLAAVSGFVQDRRGRQAGDVEERPAVQPLEEASHLGLEPACAERAS